MTERYVKILVVKLLIAAFIFLAAWRLDNYIHTVHLSSTDSSVAVKQLEPDDAAFKDLMKQEERKNWISPTIYIVALFWIVVLFWKDVFSGLRSKGAFDSKENASGGARPRSGPGSGNREGSVWTILIAVLVLVVILVILYFTIIRKPYNKPLPDTIKPYETAFLIDMEGDNTDQAVYKSVEFLNEKKVATRRVWIEQRWVQMGRRPNNGHYVPKQKLIRVDRTPITRWWTADTETGTSNKNEAIRLDSKDSSSFSSGFTVTGFVAPEDAALFLYNYKAKDLEQVIDTEVRAAIQESADRIASENDLEPLRKIKNDMIYEIEINIIPFFKTQRGITLTTIAMFGGLVYDNPDIQDSIDKVFISQQTEVVNDARNLAQVWVNKADELTKKGEAYRKTELAKAEADVFGLIVDATKQAQKSDLYYLLQKLDVRRDRIETWGGTYPETMIFMGNNVPTWIMDLSSIIETEKVAK